MKIHMGRMAGRTACRLLEQGRRATLEASYSKVYNSEACMEATSDAIQILGGYGYIREFKVERLMRDAKLIEVIPLTRTVSIKNQSARGFFVEDEYRRCLSRCCL